jgi:hypothetical protein
VPDAGVGSVDWFDTIFVPKEVVTDKPASISVFSAEDARARWNVFMSTPAELMKLMPTIVRPFSVPANQISHLMVSLGELIGVPSRYPSQRIALPALNVNEYGFAP